MQIQIAEVSYESQGHVSGADHTFVVIGNSRNFQIRQTSELSYVVRGTLSATEALDNNFHIIWAQSMDLDRVI